MAGGILWEILRSGSYGMWKKIWEICGMCPLRLEIRCMLLPSPPASAPPPPLPGCSSSPSCPFPPCCPAAARVHPPLLPPLSLLPCCPSAARGHPPLLLGLRLALLPRLLPPVPGQAHCRRLRHGQALRGRGVQRSPPVSLASECNLVWPVPDPVQGPGRTRPPSCRCHSSPPLPTPPPADLCSPLTLFSHAGGTPRSSAPRSSSWPTTS